MTRRKNGGTVRRRAFKKKSKKDVKAINEKTIP